MATSTFCGMTLKALLENPDLQHAPGALSGATSSKKKKTGNGPGDVDFTSAFLGPQLWEKTYDDSDFNLEYMDLDEFLSENGIPVVDSPAADELVDSPAISPHCCAVAERSTRCSPPHNPISSTQRLAPSPVQTHTLPIPPSISIMNPGHFLLKPKIEKAEDIPQIQNSSISSAGTLSRGSTPPVSPLPLQVDFNLSEQDIALSSIPGQTTFDPTARNFTEDELKPQPMMRKSKKIFVPEDLKDEKYWVRRKKNNCAAKRSRDARRVKENQIAMRAAYLEKENISLKEEMEKMKRENAHLKHLLIKYKSLDNSSKSST